MGFATRVRPRAHRPPSRGRRRSRRAQAVPRATRAVTSCSPLRIARVGVRRFARSSTTWSSPARSRSFAPPSRVDRAARLGPELRARIAELASSLVAQRRLDEATADLKERAAQRARPHESQFLSIASHELKTPITAMSGSSGRLRRVRRSPRERRQRRSPRVARDHEHSSRLPGNREARAARRRAPRRLSNQTGRIEFRRRRRPHELANGSPRACSSPRPHTRSRPRDSERS